MIKGKERRVCRDLCSDQQWKVIVSGCAGDALVGTRHGD